MKQAERVEKGKEPERRSVLTLALGKCRDGAGQLWKIRFQPRRGDQRWRQHRALGRHFKTKWVRNGIMLECSDEC